MSLMWPTGREKATASTVGWAWPRDSQPRSPAISPPLRHVLHSDTALHRCVKTLFSGLCWMASSASRSTRSASASERVTGRLLLTLSTGSLQSLCFTRICLQRTCLPGSTLGFLAGGSGACAASCPQSRKTHSAVRLPSAPRACAACNSSPQATRGRPVCLLRVSATSSSARVVATSLETSARKRCLPCRTTLRISGVAMTGGSGPPPALPAAPSGTPIPRVLPPEVSLPGIPLLGRPQPGLLPPAEMPPEGTVLPSSPPPSIPLPIRLLPTLKARSPKARETCSSSPPASTWLRRMACRPRGPSCVTEPPPAQMRLSSEGMSGECAGVRCATRTRPSPVSSTTMPTASPTLARNSRRPVNKPMTALQPSTALPGRARKSASTSSQLARRAVVINTSSQGPLNSESRGRSLRGKFRAQNSAHVGAASSAPSAGPLAPRLASARALAAAAHGRCPT
mmetsp:Transcript_96765/g.312482  ORF Transcript_96765/g.312482 Transcript_96765/m.312482 type:complete len:455 (-) Transcript_96765:599-1963(-)